MSISKGFDFLKVPPNSDLMQPRKLLDHSFTSQLPYSASFNDLDKPVTLKKSSNSSQPDNGKPSPTDDLNTNPKRNRLKQLSNAPKVSQRLPSPFSSTTHQKSSPIRRQNIFNKEINTEGELFGVIDNLVNIHEFKNTKELLSPLKKRRVPKNDNDELEANIQKTKNGRKEKYPLIPIKNYLLLTKLNEVLHKSDDSFRQKIDKVYRTHQGGESFFKKPLQAENIKLNEMVTLGTIKPSYGTGVVKKMLHAPTLKIYCVKEVPINTRETRQALKIWLEEWQACFYDSKQNLRVYDMFFNSPEGCLSIVSEFMGGGSIQTLLDSLVSIPEKALKKTAMQTLQALGEVHISLKKVYGALSPSQILLDRQGNIKLSLGLRNKIAHAHGHSHSHSHPIVKGKSFAEKTLMGDPNPMVDAGLATQKTLKPKAFNASPESKLQNSQDEDFSQDIFDFGYLILLCAVGGLEFFDVNDFAGKLKILLAELDKKPQDKQKYCCIIHNEDLIWSVKIPHPEEDVFQKKPVKVHRNNNNGAIFEKVIKTSPLISIKDFFVYNNFSKEFLEFLCCCLKFDSTKRSTVSMLLSSPFLVKSHIKGPMTSLRELIKISSQWSNNQTLKPEHQGASENHLNKLCDALTVVLPNCQQFSATDDNPAKWDGLLKLGPGSQRIKDLAFELGLTPARVWECISQVIQSVMEK